MGLQRVRHDLANKQQDTLLQNHTWVAEPFKVQTRPKDFSETE